ncbi:hypothetical protein [Flavobacterium sp. CS20]|nr:hypothetical protein [Flavobacterium sp. CS20]QTY28250.1 hypothetical protein IGB25_07180 [Flavobacterium sp. CS20]
MATETDKTKVKKSKAKKDTKSKKVSKTWLAMEKLQGTGEILDMKAVLK